MCLFIYIYLVIYVHTRSVTKRKESLIPSDFVIVAKQIVLVTIQIHWFRPKNNVLLTLTSRTLDANRNIVTGLISIHVIDRY